ncbi:hypothetical protein L2E82_09083 [Cichorium intybus]|uniref:Uncharacterized protein n=1 Tax=Cichorium intybus TaxID=13427 RepID=A0ACB9G9D1_CICIN|nr:hypothetical protein L2E82_09083 [Cichorium intybus]
MFSGDFLDHASPSPPTCTDHASPGSITSLPTYASPPTRSGFQAYRLNPHRQRMLLADPHRQCNECLLQNSNSS